MRNVFEYCMDDDHLEHHGIKGQKWGVRRFQNPDGSLTDAGAEHYRKKYAKMSNAFYKAANKSDARYDTAAAYNKKATRFFQKTDERQHNARVAEIALRSSALNARKAVRIMNRMNKVFGAKVVNLDPVMVSRGNSLIDRYNSFAISQTSHNILRPH